MLICAGSIVVIIRRCQRWGPGPIPGLRIPEIGQSDSYSSLGLLSKGHFVKDLRTHDLSILKSDPSGPAHKMHL